MHPDKGIDGSLRNQVDQLVIKNTRLEEQVEQLLAEKNVLENTLNKRTDRLNKWKKNMPTAKKVGKTVLKLSLPLALLAFVVFLLQPTDIFFTDEGKIVQIYANEKLLDKGKLSHKLLNSKDYPLVYEIAYNDQKGKRIIRLATNEKNYWLGSAIKYIYKPHREKAFNSHCKKHFIGQKVKVVYIMNKWSGGRSWFDPIAVVLDWGCKPSAQKAKKGEQNASGQRN